VRSILSACLPLGFVMRSSCQRSFAPGFLCAPSCQRAQHLVAFVCSSCQHSAQVACMLNHVGVLSAGFVHALPCQCEHEIRTLHTLAQLKPMPLAVLAILLGLARAVYVYTVYVGLARTVYIHRI